MEQKAQCLHSDQTLSLGYVHKVFDNSYLVVDSYDPLIRIHARRAISCLIEPQQGDMVTLMLATNGNAYILHILERENTEARLLLPAQTEICLETDTSTPKEFVNDAENKSQSLKITAENITFTCEQKLSLISKEMTTTSHKLHIGAHTLLMTGQILYTRFDNMRTACKHAIEKIQHRIGLYTKKIDHAEDIIEMQSKRTTIKNTETLRIQNKNTRIHAEQSVDVDGENIRIG